MLRSRAKPSFFLPDHPKKVRAPSGSFWETLPEPRLHTPAQSMVACPALKQNKTKRWTPQPRTSGETAVLSSSCLLSGHSRQAAPPSAGSVGGAWTPARGASDRASPAEVRVHLLGRHASRPRTSQTEGSVLPGDSGWNLGGPTAASPRSLPRARSLQAAGKTGPGPHSRRPLPTPATDTGFHLSFFLPTRALRPAHTPDPSPSPYPELRCLFLRVSGAPSHVLRPSGTPGLRAGGRCLCGDNTEARGPGGAGRMRASSDAVCSRGAQFPLRGGTWDPKLPSLVPAHQRSHSARLQERRTLHP